MKRLNLNFKLLFTLILGVNLLFTSCNDDDSSPIIDDDGSDMMVNDDDPGMDIDNGTDEGMLDLGATIQRDFVGRIVDESGEPISDVNVNIGSENTVTNESGLFFISDADVLERQAYIISEKEGFLTSFKTTIPTEGTNNVNIMLVAENIIETITTGTESTVELPSGALVSFDGNFEDEDGNEYTGNVDVIMYHLETSNPDIENIRFIWRKIKYSI